MYEPEYLSQVYHSNLSESLSKENLRVSNEKFGSQTRNFYVLEDPTEATGQNLANISMKGVTIIILILKYTNEERDRVVKSFTDMNLTPKIIQKANKRGKKTEHISRELHKIIMETAAGI